MRKVEVVIHWDGEERRVAVETTSADGTDPAAFTVHELINWAAQLAGDAVRVRIPQNEPLSPEEVARLAQGIGRPRR